METWDARMSWLPVVSTLSRYPQIPCHLAIGALHVMLINSGPTPSYQAPVLVPYWVFLLPHTPNQSSIWLHQIAWQIFPVVENSGFEILAFPGIANKPRHQTTCSDMHIVRNEEASWGPPHIIHLAYTLDSAGWVNMKSSSQYTASSYIWNGSWGSILAGKLSSCMLSCFRNSMCLHRMREKVAY